MIQVGNFRLDSFWNSNSGLIWKNHIPEVEMVSLKKNPSFTHTHTHMAIKQGRDKLCREITDQSVLKAWQQGTVCLISSHPQAAKCYQLLICAELIRVAPSSCSFVLIVSVFKPVSIFLIYSVHLLCLASHLYTHFLSTNLFLLSTTSVWLPIFLALVLPLTSLPPLSLQSSLYLTQSPSNFTLLIRKY